MTSVPFLTRALSLSLVFRDLVGLILASLSKSLLKLPTSQYCQHTGHPVLRCLEAGAHFPLGAPAQAASLVIRLMPLQLSPLQPQVTRPDYGLHWQVFHSRVFHYIEKSIRHHPLDKVIG